MNRKDQSKGKPSGRQGGGNAKKSERESGESGKQSGRQGGGERKNSYARGNSPIKRKPPVKTKTASLDKDEIRLNKYIANSGICSRREADIYIAAGSVTVNGQVVVEMGYKVKLTDEVRFDGKLINPEKKEYILLNKPKGFATTLSIEPGKKTVMDLVRNATKSRIAAVDKLDRQATGLLLFTNDSELTKKLTQSSQNVRKIYHVGLTKPLKSEDLQKIRNGIHIDDSIIEIDEISYIEGATKHEVGIKLFSNKNRVVRNIFEHLGYEIAKLDRVVFAGLTKKDLPRGTWRKLTEQEIINLRMMQS